MTRRTPLRRRGFALGLVAAVALTGCAAESAATSDASTKPSPSAKSDKDSGLATVPGYDVGEFPPVPLFVLPDLALLDSSANAVATELNEALADVAGVTATPAQCDESGVVAGKDAVFLYGDASGTYTSPDGTEQKFEESDDATINGVAIEKTEDGGEAYTSGSVSIKNFGNGSGEYTDLGINIRISEDGIGFYDDGTTSIHTSGDGSGDYTDGTVEISNQGDGSGSYEAAGLVIWNYGDGTGTVNDEPVEIDPLPPVPSVGVFPGLSVLDPPKTCGTTLTIEEGALFSSGKAALSDSADATLDAVADVLTKLDVAEATVSSHTDAIGLDKDNDKLTDKRADAVAKGLLERDVVADLTAEGFGESRPVAPNEIDGVDNPAGRQLNRRVEIFIPAV
jgi:OOP family OmpA-OmpF porin